MTFKKAHLMNQIIDLRTQLIAEVMMINLESFLKNLIIKKLKKSSKKSDNNEPEKSSKKSDTNESEKSSKKSD